MEYEVFFLGALGATVLVGVVLALAARRYPSTRRWVVVSAIGIVALPAGIVLHNVLSALIAGEEAVSFIAALVVAPAFFVVGTLGAGLAAARTGRGWETGTSLVIAGAGMGIFVAYEIFALVVTTIEGENPPYQATIEAFVLPISLLALVGGAVSGLFCALVPSRQTLA